MRDYKKYAQDLRRIAQFQNCFECYEGERTEGSCSSYCTLNKAADAIEELLAFAKFVARQAIDTGDNDGVSAEILCRKLNKLGLIETDGEFWLLPLPPKEDSYD